MDHQGALTRLAAGVLLDYLRYSLVSKVMKCLPGWGALGMCNVLGTAVGKRMVLLAGREIIRLVVRWVRLKAGVDH